MRCTIYSGRTWRAKFPNLKGAAHPNLAFIPWFDKPAESVEAANKMVATALAHSAKRLGVWNQRETDPGKVQAAAKDIANLSAGGLPYFQGRCSLRGQT